MSTAPAQRKTWLWAAAAAVVAWSGWIVIKGEDTNKVAHILAKDGPMSAMKLQKLFDLRG